MNRHLAKLRCLFQNFVNLFTEASDMDYFVNIPAAAKINAVFLANPCFFYYLCKWERTLRVTNDGMTVENTKSPVRTCAHIYVRTTIFTILSVIRHLSLRHKYIEVRAELTQRRAELPQRRCEPAQRRCEQT